MEGEPEAFRGTTYMMVIDDGLIPTLNMDLIQGRNFDRNRPSNSLSLLVNEAFLNNFGSIPPADAIGKTLSFGEDPEKYTIIGIANDFNRTSLKSEVEPTIYFPFLYLEYFVVKLSADQMDGGLLHLEKTWDEFYADMPLDYIFMDRRFASLYEEDQRLGNIFLYFTIIAILISLMGLLGLATYMAAQRTKEVGIRKVMGASVLQVIALFVGDFLKLLLLASLISIPLIYYFMESWLKNYAFRIDFPWFISVAGAVIVTLFAIATIVFQVRKVAVTPPADTLKYE
jgi:putative ABC transport system permease protein